MNRPPWTRAGFLLLLLLFPFLPPVPGVPHLAVPVAEAQDADHVDWTADDQVCRCKAGNGCWHYLRAPSDPPDDPCWCNYCTKVSRHDGTRPWPDGWSTTCGSNGKVDCFLHRHALSWGITCSARFDRRKCCNLDHWENCPRCELTEEPWGKAEHDEIQQRLVKEREVFGTKDVVVARSPHFYLVTDIPSLKVGTGGGSFRVVGTHELAHIYLERAEKAYREFVQVFGDAVSLPKPAAIYLPKRETTAGKIQAKYNASERTNLTYGGSNDGRVADGYCFNGFCNSLQKSGGDDDSLHHAVRHMIGHLLVSCWVKVDGNNRALPRWLFEGTAHWLAKRHKRLRNDVVFCADEGTAISGSGKEWEKEARKVASSSKTVPIERLLEKSTIGLLDYEDQVRAWSYLELALAEDRDRFIAVLAALRREVPTRQAWTENMGCTPEEWDQRWKDRVLGRRPTIGEWHTDDEGDETPGARERRDIRNETDMDNLAARIRSVGTCTDPKLAKVLVDQFARPSDLVRETLSVVLAKTTDPDTLAAIRETGLFHGHPMVRAFTCRVLGFAGDKASGPAIRELCADAYWLARAEASLALMRIGDPELVGSVKGLLEDSSPKVRVAAMDALASTGERAAVTTSIVARNLDHSTWQVRSAAADCLGGIGSMSGVDPLIQRATTEAGRVRKDCIAALEMITREVGLGLNPEVWAKWWARERERVQGGIPNRPEAPAEPEGPSYDEQRYGIQRPPNYGLRVFSDRVGYVLDMSNSMFNYFEPDPEAVKRLRRSYSGATKFDISREEIVQSVASLDPRARYNILVFANRPRFMNKGLVPATPDSQKKAESFLRSCRSSPGSGGTAQMTNFFDALKAVLDLPDKGDPPPGFQDTPDTMFFLTDGAPTLGEIIEADELLAWFNGLNRYSRIKVHVVAYGTMGIDLRFLRHLAEDNRGEFIHILEARPGDGAGTPPPTVPR